MMMSRPSSPRKTGLALIAAVACLGLAPAARASTDTYDLGDGHNGAVTANGTINTYYRLNAAAAAGATTLTLTQTTAVAGAAHTIATGDLILIWQTADYTGAVTSGSQTSVDLSASAAGRYELARVTAVNAGQRRITLDGGLLYAYDNASTQVVRVPEYTTVTITGTVTAPAWNGATGGLVAFLASGAVTLNGSINASGLGFRGGTVAATSGDFCGCTENDRPANLRFGNTTFPAGVWAAKGESLVAADYLNGNISYGRGNILSGAGGGDCDNSGGGGGGNGGPGGVGGQTWSGDGPGSSETNNTCVNNDANHVGRAVGGLGGAALTYAMSSHFTFGGGGGAGEENNGAGGAGGVGGGVIFVRAKSLTGTGSITASGTAGGSSDNDGAGGGGAGGAVYARFSGSCQGVGLSANGGNGGTVNYTDDHGPGGGGGGGQVLFQSTSTPGTSGACTLSAVSGVAGVWQNNTVDEGNHGAGPSTSQNNGISTILPGGFTAVSLLHFVHASTFGGEHLAWQTGSEDGTIGFEIHRGTATGPLVARVRAKAFESPVGASYETIDRQPWLGMRYVLVEIARDGRHSYGPAEHNLAPLPMRPGAVSTRAERIPLRPGLRMTAPPGDAFARVTHEGLYVLDASALSSVGLAGSPLGFTFDGIARPLFRVGSGWLFYAPAPTASDRADDAYHLFVGRHLAPATIAVRGATVRGPGTFMDTAHLEQHLQLDPGAPPEARFPWATVANGWPADVAVDAPGLQNATSLSIEVRGQIDFGVAVEHHVQASLNGVPLIDATWGGTASASFSATVPAGTLLPSGNVLEVSSPGDLGLPYDLFSLVSVDLTGPHTYRAQSDALGFTTVPNQIVQLTGFSAAPTVMDVTNPASPQLLVGAITTQATDGTFGLGFVAPNASGRRYYAAVPKAPTVDASRASEVPSGSAQWVAIAADGLESALAPLVAQRQSQGLSTLVVNVEALNDAFNHGEHGPASIQKYLAQLSPAPHDVLLVGKPSVDPHDYLQTGVPDALPSVIVLDDNEPSYAITDSALVAGADGRTPFAAIGRLPVRDATSLSAWVQKLISYEQTPSTPSGSAVWAADGFDPTTQKPDPFFAAESDRLAALFPGSASRVYVPTQGRSDLLTALDAQPDLVSYHGHADGLDWSTSGLLSYSDVSALPAARPFLLITVDCWDGMFAMPTFDPISQQLAQLPNGGAIAALASSTLVDESLDVQLDGALFRPLQDPSVLTAGDLVLHVERGLASMTGPAIDLVHAYNLTGDPATPLPTR